MRKYVSIQLAFTAAVFFSLETAAQCTFGNFPPSFTLNSGYTLNYLLGTKHTLSYASSVTALGYEGNNTGAGIQMAIYSDNSGTAGTLLAFTGTSTVGSGNQVIP